MPLSPHQQAGRPQRARARASRGLLLSLLLLAAAPPPARAPAATDGGGEKHIDWYSELPVTAAAVEFATTSGLVDGLLPCCNLLQINCSTGTLQHEPSAYNFSMFAPFTAAGKSVSVSLEGIEGTGIAGMADCCANASHCPMLDHKEKLAQQLLELAQTYHLDSFTGDWEFGHGNPVAFWWDGWNQTMAHIASVLQPHGVGLGNSVDSGCFAYDELTKTRCSPDGGHSDPCCCPASRDVPWADVLTDMYACTCLPPFSAGLLFKTVAVKLRCCTQTRSAMSNLIGRRTGREAAARR